MFALHSTLPQEHTGRVSSSVEPSVSVHVDSDLRSLREHMIDCDTRNHWRSGLTDLAERVQSLMVGRMILSVLCAGGTGLIVGGLVSLLHRG